MPHSFCFKKTTRQKIDWNSAAVERGQVVRGQCRNPVGGMVAWVMVAGAYWKKLNSMYMLNKRIQIYFVACQRNRRVEGDSKILDQTSGRMELPFTEMEKAGRRESLEKNPEVYFGV